MLKNYSIKLVNGITIIQFTKKPTFDEAQIVIDDIAENFPYTKRLWDFTNIKFDFTMDEITAISEYGKLKFINPNKLAVVAPDNWAYIELQFFQGHRQQKEHSDVRIFRTTQKAVEWLKL